MKTAKVVVIRAFTVGDVWFLPSEDPATIPAEDAIEWESKGYCDVLEIDGKKAVWGSCCGGAHQ